MDFQISANPFHNIPRKKLDDALEDIMAAHSNNGVLTKEGALLSEVFYRYYNANIPVDYWWREMTDWNGPDSLIKYYTEITSDIKGAYKEGKRARFGGKHGIGKQLSLDTELPTPGGFIKLSELREGDVLFDEQGNTCTVTELHPIQTSPESYLVEFDDGSSVKACSDHRWFTYTRKERVTGVDGQVRTTKEILETLRVGGKQKIANHSIPLSKPIQYSNPAFEIDPYTLGCWLGDGTNREGSVETADQEILDEIGKVYDVTLIDSTVTESQSCRYRVGEILHPPGRSPIGELTALLKRAGLLCNKHIPDHYLRGTVEQRLALLQGLMDTDGSISEGGLCEFSSSIPILAEGVAALVRSLGIKTGGVRRGRSTLNGKRCKDRYRVTFTTTMPVFRLSRKLKNIRLQKTQKTRTTHRFITNVTPIDPEPMRCITVDSPSHLFLVTRNFIPTHNTMACACILKRIVETDKFSALYVNLHDIISVMLNSQPDVKTQAKEILLNVDFLVIDEVDSRFMPTENAADLFGRILEPILRTRIQNRMPLFFCTNTSKVEDSFSGPLQASIQSLMYLVKTVPVIGGDDARLKIKKGEL